MNKIIKKISAVIVTLILIFQYSYVFAFSKNETVFTNLDSNGNVKSTVVDEHLKLDENEKNSKIEDDTELENILNINGEEAFTLKGNLLEWETSSKDVYYQGTTSKIVPIAVNVKYYLDGEEKDLKDIEGKAGEITIEIKFTNNLKNEVKINGKYRTLYTPFVVMCGTMISNDGNSEFDVTNGKVIDNGRKTIVAAISSPGLYESLNLKEFKDLDTVKISYKTEKFNKNASIYIAATPKLIDDSDLDVFNKMDELVSNINTLQKNMNTIEDGANELKDGAKALEEGASNLATGAGKVNDGVKSVADGASKLKSGTDELANGANNLKNGASSLASGASDLKTGAQSVADGVSTISEKLQEVVEGVEQLKTGAGKLDDGLEQIISSIEAAQSMLDNKEIDYLKEQNTSTARLIKTTYETYHLDKLSIDAIIANPLFDNTTKANLITVKNNYENGLVTLLMGNNEAIEGITKNISDNLIKLKSALEQAKAGSGEISQGLVSLKEGVSQLYSGSVTLSNGANSLKDGATTLSAGANTLSDGVVTLQKGTNELKNGANELANGSKELSNGTAELAEGANTLADGSLSLSDGTEELASGIARFNKEGINKLSSYANKISDYSSIAKELINLSKNYKGFSCNNATVTNFVFVIK